MPSNVITFSETPPELQPKKIVSVIEENDGGDLHSWLAEYECGHKGYWFVEPKVGQQVAGCSECLEILLKRVRGPRA